MSLLSCFQVPVYIFHAFVLLHTHVDWWTSEPRRFTLSELEGTLEITYQAQSSDFTKEQSEIQKGPKMSHIAGERKDLILKHEELYFPNSRSLADMWNPREEPEDPHIYFYSPIQSQSRGKTAVFGNCIHKLGNLLGLER